MNATDALRFLAHETKRELDDKICVEMVRVSLPSIMEVLQLHPMDNFEAIDFLSALKIEAARARDDPLEECLCKNCGFSEALRIAGTAVVHWCDGCGSEQIFLKVIPGMKLLTVEGK